MRYQTGEAVPVELAGLIAWVAASGRYAALPEDTASWALAQLRIESQTPPDEIVLGLRAWEAVLDGAANRPRAAPRGS